MVLFYFFSGSNVCQKSLNYQTLLSLPLSLKKQKRIEGKYTLLILLIFIYYFNEIHAQVFFFFFWGQFFSLFCVFCSNFINWLTKSWWNRSGARLRAPHLVKSDEYASV